MTIYTLERDYLGGQVEMPHKVLMVEGFTGKRIFTCEFDENTTYPVYENKSTIYFDKKSIPRIESKAIA